MANLSGEIKVSGAFGGVQYENGQVNGEETIQEVGTIRNNNLPTETGFWNKFKSFWLQEIDWTREIKVVLTPRQQKIEDEINEFLHQEITWEKVHDFLFQEITFGKKNK